MRNKDELYDFRAFGLAIKEAAQKRERCAQVAVERAIIPQLKRTYTT